MRHPAPPFEPEVGAVSSLHGPPHRILLQRFPEVPGRLAILATIAGFRIFAHRIRSPSRFASDAIVLHGPLAREKPDTHIPRAGGAGDGSPQGGEPVLPGAGEVQPSRQ